MALAAFNPPGVKAVINFAGGMVEGDCDHGRDALATGAARLGAMPHIPSLYKYAINNEPSIFISTSESLNVARSFTDMKGGAYV